MSMGGMINALTIGVYSYEKRNEMKRREKKKVEWVMVIR